MIIGLILGVVSSVFIFLVAPIHPVSRIVGPAMLGVSMLFLLSPVVLEEPIGHTDVLQRIDEGDTWKKMEVAWCPSECINVSEAFEIHMHGDGPVSAIDYGFVLAVADPTAFAHSPAFTDKLAKKKIIMTAETDEYVTVAFMRLFNESVKTNPGIVAIDPGEKLSELPESAKTAIAASPLGRWMQKSGLSITKCTVLSFKRTPGKPKQ